MAQLFGLDLRLVNLYSYRCSAVLMQTLNVGAGRTDEEYKAAAEQCRADLLADSRNDAIYFFVAAGLAGLGTGLLPLRLNIFVSIGAIDVLTLYGGQLVRLHPLLAYSAAATWVFALVGLGLAAQSGHRWAFLAGVVLYSADMIALGLMFSLWAIGVHAFFVLKWFQGQKALQDLKDATASR
ncbi:MAG: hypothetical protein ACXWBH_02250 [Candidatus Angelobacter sp.]